MLAEEPEEQHFITVVKGCEEDVLRQVGRLREVLRERPAHLLLDGEDAWRQHADEVEADALLVGERRALVDAGVTENEATAKCGLPDLLCRVPTDGRVVRGGREVHFSSLRTDAA